MKRILTLLILLMSAVSMTVTAHAALDELESDVRTRLSGAETSDVADELTELGIDPEEPASVSGLSVKKVLDYVAKLIKSALARPVRVILTTVVLAAICQLTTTLSYKAGLYGELFVLICFIAVSPYAVEAFSSIADAMLGCQAFMGAYIPAFAAVVATSGNVTAAVSYNAIVMYFCEAAAALATTVLKPVLACMLVMSVTQALNPDLMNLTSTIRNALTTMIGFVMTLFLGIISLQTIVGRGVDGLAIRAGKYAVSSFVPVIGYSLSESYKAVSLSLSAIRTAIGGFGIVVMCLYMLSPIITATVYKFSFNVCAWLCRLTGADRIGSLMSGLSDVFSFASTVSTVFMLMLTVSTGMLILLGGELLA